MTTIPPTIDRYDISISLPDTRGSTGRQFSTNQLSSSDIATRVTASTQPLVVPVDELRAFTTALLDAAGVPEDDAAVIVDCMVWAELRGIDLGVRRVRTLIERIRRGGTSADPSPVILHDSPAFAVLDGRRAWGTVTATRAMKIAIDKSRTEAMGACVVRDTGNAQAMGYYASLAVQQDLIGLAITNSLPLQAPWGGTERVLGNQAFAFGCPAGRHDPIIFDGATTAISWVGIHRFQARGEMIPPGLALDAHGVPTTDPVAALAGLLLPAGGHRGFGLALMWELLTGVLSGGETFGPTVSGGREPDVPAGLSTFLLAIDPSRSMPYGQFLDRVDAVIDAIHASPPAPGVDRVAVPGERGAETARVRERDGIPLAAERAGELRDLAAELAVELPGALS